MAVVMLHMHFKCSSAELLLQKHSPLPGEKCCLQTMLTIQTLDIQIKVQRFTNNSKKPSQLVANFNAYWQLFARIISGEASQ